MTSFRLRILYVDDNPGDLDLVRETLEQEDANIDFYTASNGEEALDFLFKRKQFTNSPKPNLILLDLNMPRKNGFETLKVIKASDGLKHIPVVIFTSSTAASDLLAAYQAYANAYVIKPTRLEDFFRIIHDIRIFWQKTATVIH